MATSPERAFLVNCISQTTTQTLSFRSALHERRPMKNAAADGDCSGSVHESCGARYMRSRLGKTIVAWWKMNGTHSKDNRNILLGCGTRMEQRRIRWIERERLV